ncbi:hypothetical protein H8356DRAFT_964723 [Neocallimastix lanati (nom. inval.)]|uniref:Rab3 GTPase-activating protein catalytic subunit n=1 Tax=Neocallimastix californiae TaxID=1754190 RepID=A0A1Y2CHX9_9FUNG|nr:hypothetical protein H8356DRAFT_964723 [Neocallimastix sp. JGI-2020a]ORY46653.1 hypothetical protein LY90DRAFT_509199 [Neocallimastix californiae]|eukprot:ORY46653.1 hypothetical protein LY90DRAFT_509199 [Neocallimastix californiae]
MNKEDDEIFEIIDYTSIGSWEKLVASIEEVIHLWGIDDGKLGSFDPDIISSLSDIGDVDNEETPYMRQEKLVMGETMFILSYHYLPGKEQYSENNMWKSRGKCFNYNWNDNDDTLIDTNKVLLKKRSTINNKIDTSNIDMTLPVKSKTNLERKIEFHNSELSRLQSPFHSLITIPIQSDGMPSSTQSYANPLHRWTGFTHLLTIEVYNTSKNHLSTTTLDVNTANLLISSFSIAFHNTGCILPIFVPVASSSKSLFTGLASFQLDPSGDGLQQCDVEIKFNSMFMPYVPKKYQGVINLTNFFIHRCINNSLNIKIEDKFFDDRIGKMIDNIRMASVYIYRIENWDNKSYFYTGDFSPPLPLIPFGTTSDPLFCLSLHVHFNYCSPLDFIDDMNKEKELDPFDTPVWIIRRLWKTDNTDKRYGLYQTLSGVLQAWQRSASVLSQNNDILNQIRPGDIFNNSLFFKSSYGLNVNNAESDNSFSIVDNLDIRNVLYSLFRSENSDKTEENEAAINLTQQIHSNITIPPGSFLWELGIFLLNTTSPSCTFRYKQTTLFGFLKAIWADTVMVFNKCWETCTYIPRVNIKSYTNRLSDWQFYGYDEITKSPNICLKFNLLQQKLEMLNCCAISDNSGDALEKLFDKITADDDSEFLDAHYDSNIDSDMEEINNDDRREEDKEGTQTGEIIEKEKEDESKTIKEHESSNHEELELKRTSEVSSSIENKNEIEDDEENDKDEAKNSVSELPSHINNSKIDVNRQNSTDSEAFFDTIDYELVPERQGNLKIHPYLTLIKTGEPLYIPELQEPGSLTEDMIQEQEELFEHLGSSHEATKQRAKLQSRHLQSDMEAFKAANPNAIFEDFVRWQSPRDWIVEDNGEDQDVLDEDAYNKKHGRLSMRMTEPGNLWIEIWKKSKAIPINKQEPIFDYKDIAEKILIQLFNIPPQFIYIHLLPDMFIACYNILASHHLIKKIPFLENVIKNLGAAITSIRWRDLNMDYSFHQLLDLTSMFRDAEVLLEKAISLLSKLPEQYQLVEKLLLYSDAVVHTDEEQSCICRLFGFENEEKINPTSKEFIFRSVISKYGDTDQPLMQRMYVLQRDNEFRVVESKAYDTTDI